MSSRSLFTLLVGVGLVAVFVAGTIPLHAQNPTVQFPNKKPGGRSGPTGEFRNSSPKSTPSAPERKSDDPLPLPVPAPGVKKIPGSSPGAIPEFPPGALNIGVVDTGDGATLPSRLEGLAKEGAVALAGKEYEKARGIFEQMVAEVPNNELARANLGMAEYRLKNYPAAREQFNTAVAINPRVAQNWLTLGLVHFRENNLEMAISSLTRAIALEPENAKAHLYLGVVVGKYGWPEAAEKELQRSVQLDAGDSDAHFNLALIYLQKPVPAYELARRHYYTAVDLGAKPDPRFVEEIKAAELKASQSTN